MPIMNFILQFRHGRLSGVKSLLQFVNYIRLNFRGKCWLFPLECMDCIPLWMILFYIALARLYCVLGKYAGSEQGMPE